MYCSGWKSSVIDSTTWPAIFSSAGRTSTSVSSDGNAGSLISSGHSRVWITMMSRLEKFFTRSAASRVLLRNAKCTMATRSVSESALASST